MPGNKRVVRAFRGVGKAGQAAELPQRVKLIPAAGEQLVYIALVSDVPQDAVVGRVEDEMQRDGQLDHSEVGGKMTAVFGYHVYQPAAQLFGKRGQFFGRQLFYVGGRIDLFDKHRKRPNCKWLAPCGVIF